MSYNFNKIIKNFNLVMNGELEFEKVVENEEEKKRLAKEVKEQVLSNQGNLVYVKIDKEFQKLRENEKQKHTNDFIDLIVSL